MKSQRLDLVKQKSHDLKHEIVEEEEVFDLDR
jgi:hypothetical protein